MLPRNKGADMSDEWDALIDEFEEYGDTEGTEAQLSLVTGLLHTAVHDFIPACRTDDFFKHARERIEETA